MVEVIIKYHQWVEGSITGWKIDRLKCLEFILGHVLNQQVSLHWVVDDIYNMLHTMKSQTCLFISHIKLLPIDASCHGYKYSVSIPLGVLWYCSLRFKGSVCAPGALVVDIVNSHELYMCLDKAVLVLPCSAFYCESWMQVISRHKIRSQSFIEPQPVDKTHKLSFIYYFIPKWFVVLKSCGISFDPRQLVLTMADRTISYIDR